MHRRRLWFINGLKNPGGKCCRNTLSSTVSLGLANPKSDLPLVSNDGFLNVPRQWAEFQAMQSGRTHRNPAGYMLMKRCDLTGFPVRCTVWRKRIAPSGQPVLA